MAQIRVVSGAGDQPKDPARTVGVGVQLGAEPAPAAAKRFGRRRAAHGTAGSAVGLAGRTVQQQQPVCWQARAERFEDQLPPTAQAPAPPAAVDAGPEAQRLGEVTPWRASPADPEHGFNEATQRPFVTFHASGICCTISISDIH